MAVWRCGAALRTEGNRLVGVLAARHGAPHGRIHAQLRRGPGAGLCRGEHRRLEDRRDHLMGLLAG